ncbi:MAG TPA: AMP-binding protein [Bryobacteraceae bacterium]|nr:AMP-binding protein [Bryobacteraceae bacterium]
MPLPDESSTGKLSAARAIRVLRVFDDGAGVMRPAWIAPPAAGSQSPCRPERPRNGAPSGLVEADTIHRRLEQNAARDAQEIAVSCAFQKITYGELNIKANRLARYLRRFAASPATPIAIVFEPSIATIVCLVAVLKAGNPYIPLDPEAAPTQTAAILAQTEALVLLPSQATTVRLPARRGRTINVESEKESIEAASAVNLPLQPAIEGAECPAFHAFSENRGGAAISHRACLETVESLRATLGVTSADSFAVTMQPDAEIAGICLLAPLLCGARLILAPSGEDGMRAFFLDQIERSRSIVMQATPAIAAALVRARWQVRAKLKLICAGDSWPDELMKTLDAAGVDVWRLHAANGSYQLTRCQ